MIARFKTQNLLLFGLVLLPLWHNAAGPSESPEAPAGIVGLEIVSAEVPADVPHATPTFSRRRASGILVGAGLVLTNLDCVRDSISIKVRMGSATADATLRHRAYDAGLALVSVPTGGTPISIPSDSASTPTGTSVDLIGFDGGSGTVRLTRRRVAGSMQRTLHNSDVDVRPVLLLDDPPGEISADLNGGAVFHEGRFLGTYHQGRPSYVLPAQLAAHVLVDVSDNTYHGFPNAGFLFQNISGSVHRAAAGLGADEQAVLVRRVLFGSGAWERVRTGDLLLSANGNPMTASGELALRDGPQTLGGYFASLQHGPVELEVRRGTQKVKVSVIATPNPTHSWKRRRQRDLRPYLVTGGLVFQELDYDLIHRSPAGRIPLLRYRYSNFDEDGLGEQVDRDVVLTSVLADPATHGAVGFRFGIVEYLNQLRIRNLKHLAAELRRSQDRFLVLRFMDRTAPLVLERESLPGLDERIFSRYRVRAGGTVEADP